MAPQTGAIDPKYERVVGNRAIRSQGSVAPKTRAFARGLEAEAREIAVADCKARAGSQKAVDRGHKPSKQRARWSD